MYRYLKALAPVITLILVANMPLFFTGCTDEKTDEFMLQQDRGTLESSLNAPLTNLYKFLKICSRATASGDTSFPEYQTIKRISDNIYSIIDTTQNDTIKKLTVKDYVRIYTDYLELRSFVNTTDEDSFPTLLEGNAIRNGEMMDVYDGHIIRQRKPPLKGQEKLEVQSFEHAAFSVFMLIDRQSFTKDIMLYECFKTDASVLPDHEFKAILQWVRAFLFLEKGLYYLSEESLSMNIDWLNANPDADLTMTSIFVTETFFPTYGDSNLTALRDEYTYNAFHGLNYLFRGLDRLMMEREIDEERAVQDLAVFINDAAKMGLDNELIWCIQTYVYLQHEQSDSAIISLTKLSTSPLLSDKERASINESIGYLENREPGKVLNGVYDKYFISKIASKYMYARLAEVDWEQLAKENDLPYAEKVLNISTGLTEFMENLEQATTKERLLEQGEKLKEGGKKLWESITN